MKHKTQKLTEGTTVFYIVDSHVYSGKAVHIEETNSGYKFAIDSYGACEGNYKIDSCMLGIYVFLERKTAQRYADDPDYNGGLKGYC